eukprot:gene17447-19882_t
MAQTSDILNLNVGGVKYSLFSSNIRKHPGSVFQKLLSKSIDNKSLTVYRDGMLFKFVNAFLVNGQLPRDSSGRAELDCDELLALKNEATFFGLAQLQKECGLALGDVTLPGPLLQERPELEIADKHASLIEALRQVWRPLTIGGRLSKDAFNGRLLKNTRGGTVDVEELTLLAKGIAPTNRITQPYILEIDACLLNGHALHNIEREIDVSKLFPDVAVDIRARKLVIRTRGGVLDRDYDSSEKDYLGFVEVLLNSTHIGGYLTMTQNFADTNNWVAAASDAFNYITAVKSGTRVSLLFGVYGAPTSKPLTLITGRTEYDYWGRLLESSRDADEDEADEIDHIIRTAKYIQQTQNTAEEIKFEIDALYLDEKELSEIISFEHKLKSKIRSMFPYRELTFRPTKLQLRTAGTSDLSDPEIFFSGDKKEGYLGTVVLVNRDEEYEDQLYEGGLVTVTDSKNVSTTIDATQNWYAVAAGGTSA